MKRGLELEWDAVEVARRRRDAGVGKDMVNGCDSLKVYSHIIRWGDALDSRSTASCEKELLCTSSFAREVRISRL